MKSFIKFVFITYSPTGKTGIWEVFSCDSVGKQAEVTSLGAIKWFGRWRRYCFFPGSNTVFDTGCLEEIANFCDTKTRLHNYETRKRRK